MQNSDDHTVTEHSAARPPAQYLFGVGPHSTMLLACSQVETPLPVGASLRQAFCLVLTPNSSYRNCSDLWTPMRQGPAISLLGSGEGQGLGRPLG